MRRIFALGVVINRPLGKSLVDHKKEYAFSSLSDIPLYEGGPVNKEQVILIAWKMDREHKDFKIYFGKYILLSRSTSIKNQFLCQDILLIKYYILHTTFRKSLSMKSFIVPS